MTDALFVAGRNCWKTAAAGRASVIIDACDYYRIIRRAMMKAEHRILIIGWDFDPRIVLDRTEGGDPDETLGSFLLGLAKTKPGLSIDILKWDLGMLKMLGRGSALLWLLRWARAKAINFELDHAHPPGCSHHQKIVVIDDVFAVCGGIDMTADRWDRSAHEDDDPNRVRPGGQPYGPWHDVTMAVDGAAARAIGDLARDRWLRATGRAIAPVERAAPIWPDGLEPNFAAIEFAVARTQPEHDGHPEIREIEKLFVALIERAERFVYIENQYFTSPVIAAAITRRVEGADPPEFVLIGPIKADGWLEQKAMDGARIRLAQAIGRHDKHHRFRIYTPVTKSGADIYVHAKVMIVDDVILKVGSANMNNRSLGLDSECDLAFEADDDGQAKGVTDLRTRLMAEHLGVDESVLAAKFTETGSLIATIEALRGQGKTLKPLALEALDATEDFIAETELLDPESPDAMFESMTKRTLWSRFRRHSGKKSGTDR